MIWSIEWPKWREREVCQARWKVCRVSAEVRLTRSLSEMQSWPLLPGNRKQIAHIQCVSIRSKSVTYSLEAQPSALERFAVESMPVRLPSLVDLLSLVLRLKTSVAFEEAHTFLPLWQA